MARRAVLLALALTLGSWPALAGCYAVHRPYTSITIYNCDDGHGAIHGDTFQWHDKKTGLNYIIQRYGDRYIGSDDTSCKEDGDTWSCD